MPPISVSSQNTTAVAVTAATDRDVRRTLQAASRDLQARIEMLDSSSGIASATRRAQLIRVRRDIGTMMEQTWTAVEGQTKIGMFQAADLSANQMMDLDADIGMPVNAILGYSEGMQFNSHLAAEAMMTKKQYGHTLSQRVYRNQQASVSRVNRLVEQGLISGFSAKDIAQSVRRYISPDTPGGVSYAAMRLARTEVNNAYHEAQKVNMAKRPWIEWVRWNLSGSHPKPDICDTMAQGGNHPTEAGLYSRDRVPSRPHPQCFCFITAETVSPDEFLDNLVGGEYDPWLSEQGLLC